MSRSLAIFRDATLPLAALGVALLATATLATGAAAVPTTASPAPPSGQAAVKAATAAASARGPHEAKPRLTSCQICHASADLFSAEDAAKVQAVAGDVHGKVGLSCHDCHGGNPDPALAEDADAAMSPHAPVPFRGAPKRTEIPAFCGRCHSDPAFMKRYQPDPRVDQEREYATSRHGEQLAKGDTKVAVCVDCHGVHGIRPPDDPLSPVYPTHVAETCAKCHADPKHMAGYTLPDGRPLPTDQYASWQASVHAAAMRDKGDLSAPTCNDCHGNHGAAPPGIGSLSFVCGQCHGREAELFRKSAKSKDFEDHNELLSTAGPEGCRSCHDKPPQSVLEGVHGFSECTTCHGNHAVVTPRVTMLAPLPAVPCALCHEPGVQGPAVVPEPPARRKHYEQVRDALVAQAKAQHLEGADRFDWLIDQARTLSTHTDLDEKGTRTQRPEFARLFTKFRLGKTTVGFKDPTSGTLERRRLRQCSDCHGGEDSSGGLATAQAFRDQLQQLTGLIGRAERIVLAAKRGGVQVGDASEQIDAAVDAQIQLQVLVHTFDPKGAFAAKHKEGVEHATAALTAGQRSLDELKFRHRGLGVSLLAILLVLVALALKIRSLPASE
jgi:hypothetical protein